jgi:hypothetical protein
MREHILQPRHRRRYVATTDSDHDQPIYPNRTKDLMIDGTNQLWFADITYVAMVDGFVYVAVILDAWSRRVVGYAISRSIDIRLTLAALIAAIERQKSRRQAASIIRTAVRKATSSGRRNTDIRYYASHSSSASAGVFNRGFFAVFVEGCGNGSECLGAMRAQVRPSGSTGAATHWCSRWCCAAKGSEDRRSRLGCLSRLSAAC